MEQINYTFIIPHKNCPDLLKRCVDSIPKRDDVQIIVVDDNSDEGKKPSLCERNGLEVTLLDANHSKGAGRARNVALKHAKGKWLLFADADDYFSSDLKKLLDFYAIDEETDIVYLGANKFDEKGVFSTLYETDAIQAYVDGKPDAEMHLRYNMWTPWSRMVKREIVVRDNILFDEIPAANDKMFGLKCSKYSSNIKVFNEVVYHYYRPTFPSQTDKKRNNNMFTDMLNLRGRTVSLYQEVGYMKIPSVLEIVLSSDFIKGKSLFSLLKDYKRCLKNNRISIWHDLIRFVKGKMKR